MKSTALKNLPDLAWDQRRMPDAPHELWRVVVLRTKVLSGRNRTVRMAEYFCTKSAAEARCTKALEHGDKVVSVAMYKLLKTVAITQPVSGA